MKLCHHCYHDADTIIHFASLRWTLRFGAYCGRGSNVFVTFDWRLVECPDCHTLLAHDEAMRLTTT